MLNAPFAGDLHRAVGGTVVDNQDFDLIHPVDVTGQMVQRHAERFRLVIAGNLNNQLHWQALPYVWCAYQTNDIIPFFLPPVNDAYRRQKPEGFAPSGFCRSWSVGSVQVAGIDLFRHVGKFIGIAIGHDHVAFALEAR